MIQKQGWNPTQLPLCHKNVSIEHASKLNRESDMKKDNNNHQAFDYIALLMSAYYGRKESVLYFRFRCLYDRISGM